MRPPAAASDAFGGCQARPVSVAVSTRTRADPTIVKALARAHRWKRMLEEGRYASISELATAEKLDCGYLGRILQLTLLAPDVVEAVLDGRQPQGRELSRLMEPLPVAWVVVRRADTSMP